MTPSPVLELDLGNTRVKWRLRSDAGEQLGAVAHDALADALPAAPGSVRVRAVSVAGEAREARCLQALASAGYPAPRFAQSTSSLDQVRNGYEVPEALGVDRWLAILAANARVDAACLVVDAGSALTLDVVDARGAHRGGWITPGLALMRDSLRRGTAGVRPGASALDVTEPGRDTSQAVEGGLLCMEADFVLARWAALAAQDDRACIVLTGGDAPALLPWLQRGAPGRVRHEPTLVLDGLELAVP